MKRIKAWHFIKEDYRLRYSNQEVKAGDTVTVNGPVKLCEHGLHASRRVIDALRYAPGPIVCRVVMSGDIIEGDHKLVASERYIEWTLDVTWILHEFACWCAEQALKQANVKDTRCWNAIATKRKWLDHEATDHEFAAAWAAAGGVAMAAAWDASWDAAGDTQNRKLTRMLMSAD